MKKMIYDIKLSLNYPIVSLGMSTSIGIYTQNSCDFWCYFQKRKTSASATKLSTRQIVEGEGTILFRLVSVEVAIKNFKMVKVRVYYLQFW